LTQTFGVTGIGESTFSVAQITGLYAAPAFSGTVDSISFYVRAVEGTAKLKAALYVYNGLLDAGALIAETEEIVIDTTVGWKTCNFLEPKPYVTAGTVYFICAWRDVASTFNYYADFTEGNFYLSLTYGAWPDPMVGEKEALSRLSIYATYTEVGAYLNFRKS